MPAITESLVDLSRVFLPAGSMRQLDRITGLSEQGLTAEIDVGPDHWIYDLHFPGDPIFPGSLMIEAAGQLVAVHAWCDDPHGRPRLAKTSASFLEPVGPADETLLLEATVRRRRNIRFGDVSLRARGREVAAVEVVLAVLGD